MMEKIDVLDNESVKKINAKPSEDSFNHEQYEFHNIIYCGKKENEGFQGVQMDAQINGWYLLQQMQFFMNHDNWYLVAKVVKGNDYNKVVVIPVVADMISNGSVDLYMDLDPLFDRNNIARLVEERLNSIDIIKLMKEKGSQVLEEQISLAVDNHAIFPQKNPIFGLLLPNQEETMLVGINHEEFEFLKRYEGSLLRFSGLIENKEKEMQR